MKGNRGRSVKLRKLIRIDAYILLAVFLLTNTLPQRAAALGAYELWDVKFNWARPAVNYALSKGYMAGVSATSFDPTGTVSRAQVAQVLYQKAGAPEVDLSQNVFRDVKPGAGTPGPPSGAGRTRSSPGWSPIFSPRTLR